MATDREGMPDSGTATIDSGDSATTVTTVLDTRDDANFEVTEIIITYPPSSANTQVQFFDDPDGTSDANLDDALLTVDVATGTNEPFILTLSDPDLRDFEQDVLVEPDGNQDSDIQVYVGGKSITEALTG